MSKHNFCLLYLEVFFEYSFYVGKGLANRFQPQLNDTFVCIYTKETLTQLTIRNIVLASTWTKFVGVAKFLHLFKYFTEFHQFQELLYCLWLCKSTSKCVLYYVHT